MADFNNLALTASGIKALLAAQAGTTLTLSKVGMGSGSVSGSSVNLKDLVTPKIMMPITEKKIDNAGFLTIAARMTNEDITEGFNWCETGLFFKDESGNDVLFAYSCVTGGKYDYVPPYSDQRYLKYMRIANIVSNSNNIVVEEPSGILYVDTLTFEEYQAEVAERFESIGGSGTKIEYISMIVSAVSWTGAEAPYIYDLTATYPNEGYDIDVLADMDTLTVEQREAMINAQITGGTSNKLYALGEKPTVDIPVTLEVVSK